MLETYHLSALAERDHIPTVAVQFAQQALSVLNNSPQAKEAHVKFQYEVSALVGS